MFYAVDMEENQVHSILRDTVKRLSLWHNFAEHGLVFSTLCFWQDLYGSQKKSSVSFTPYRSYSRVNTLVNSPPLSVRRRWKTSQKRSPAVENALFRAIILEATSTALLLSSKNPAMKSHSVKCRVMMTLPSLDR